MGLWGSQVRILPPGPSSQHAVTASRLPRFFCAPATRAREHVEYPVLQSATASAHRDRRRVDPGARPGAGSWLPANGLAPGARRRSCRRCLQRRRGRADPALGHQCRDRCLLPRADDRVPAAWAHRWHRAPSLRGSGTGDLQHRREQGRAGAHRRRRRCRDLRTLRGRNRRSQRSPLSLSVHQLHPLRAAAEHRPRHSLRSRQHQHGGVRAVSGLRRRVCRSGRSALPCPAQCLSGLRAESLAGRWRGIRPRNGRPRSVR